jgi:hypothetical protein
MVQTGRSLPTPASRTTSDTVSVADALANTRLDVRTLPETVGIADAITVRTALVARSLAEATGLADAFFQDGKGHTGGQRGRGHR